MKHETLKCILLGGSGLIKEYTRYQVVIDLQTLETSPKPECDQYGGNLLDLAPGDGSEAFCVCKYGYAGYNCGEKVIKESSAVLESMDLMKWSEKLHVPGMFDLMDAIEKSTEVITDHVTKVIHLDKLYIYYS